LGVGPGNSDYLTNIAAKKLREAEVVVASRRLLKEFAQPRQQTYPITGDLQLAVDYIQAQSKNHRVVVLVSGDSGLYSFSNYLTTHIEDLGKLEIVPGISPVQLLFAKIKRSWEHVSIISAHGREAAKVQIAEFVKGNLPVAVLTGGGNTPQTIAAWLLDHGCPDVVTVVGANLSYHDEVIYQGLLSDIANHQDPLVNSIMVIGHV
jgi:cobalt-precorrin-7 (C5)-methyltransferase